MKLFISIDMEGIWGLSSWRESQEAISRYMTNELNLILSIIFKHNKNAEIYIADSHSLGENLIVNDLPKNVHVIRGFPRSTYMMSGLDNSFSGVFLIGYHAPIGFNPGVMDHTYSSSTFYKITINGKIVGEAEINGMLAAYYGVPVLLISGDDILHSFSQKNFPETQFVITKKAISRFAAEMIPYDELVKRYENAIKKALESIGKVKPLDLRPPYTIEVELIDTSSAYLVSQIPGAVSLDGRRVSFSTSDFMELYKFIMVSSYLGWINRNLMK